MPYLSYSTLLALALVTAACGASESRRDVQAAPAVPAQPAQADEALLARADSARIQGADTASLWVIEVSDYQCPFCRTWHEQTYEPFRREFVETGRVRFAYLHFPLPNHQNAWPAAEAAMCAAAQGRFWAMHDRIFATQQHWAAMPNATSHFDSLAADAGISMPEYRNCVMQRTMRPLVQGDFDRSLEVGVNSTPTFIIGNRMVLGAQPIEAFRQVIESELARQR